MITADNITDEQIRELHKVVKPRGVGDSFCRIALGIPLWEKTTYGDAMNWSFDQSDPEVRARARAFCARMLNARAGVKP